MPFYSQFTQKLNNSNLYILPCEQHLPVSLVRYMQGKPGNLLRKKLYSPVLFFPWALINEIMRLLPLISWTIDKNRFLYLYEKSFLLVLISLVYLREKKVICGVRKKPHSHHHHHRCSRLPYLIWKWNPQQELFIGHLTKCTYCLYMCPIQQKQFVMEKNCPAMVTGDTG
jgi:hypothetical protein